MDRTASSKRTPLVQLDLLRPIVRDDQRSGEARLLHPDLSRVDTLNCRATSE
jgi:hypothetical protein